MANIAYTIWCENLNSAIIRSQVYDVLIEKQRIEPQDNICIVAFQPFYKMFSQKEKIKKTISILKQSNISLIQVPCFKIPRLGLSSGKWYIFPFVFLQSFPILLFYKIIKKISILHCRSYPITLASIAIKKLSSAKIVFDPRSSFPEEQLISGKERITYNIWKYIEKIYLNNANVTVSITRTYTDHFKKAKYNTEFVEIPNNVDTNKFRPDKETKKRLRSQLGIGNDEIVFCYSGSLNNSWNDPNTYAEFIIQLRMLNIKHRFLFITLNIAQLKNSFNLYGIREEEYIAISCDLDEMPNNLAITDFGLNIMTKKDIRMSIKSAEYLAMGLPIVTNSNVLGAKEIIEKYNTGLVLDNMNLKEINNLIISKEKLSINCREVACEFFSTKKVAQEYSNIYKCL
ncbi:hypothetical protein GCQ56_05480 [Marinifilum sp. N1E240]|uniref:hypothetical protein n=1 Tax=Marinifilum sp. N1E240 TaxID=2608082 RepID=UPI00128E0CCA|nr:hypothetical protein [Marinifilum sp. N1E240]MPQ46455.1 hypothetical protein [Marinifilum sp. N1E240]